MKVLLINAKDLLLDVLAGQAGIEVVGLWDKADPYHVESPLASYQSLQYSAGSKLDPRSIWHARRVLQEHQPDIVHAFFSRPLAHTALAVSGLRRRPKIVSLRGIMGKLSWRNAGDWITYWHPLVDAHTCESNAVRSALIASGIRPERCSVIYNCMHKTNLQRPGRAGLRQFDVPDDAFVISTMAAIRRVKGIDLLLKAAIQCSGLSDLYVVLFGRVMDPEVEALAADLRIRDRVRLVGHRSDAAELISGADVLVMPSRSEGTPLALMEAMYQGVCPIVSDAGGMKEIARHEREGLVVPREDVPALARAIRRLHGDRQLVTQFSAAAQQRITDSFTAEKMAERCMEVYRQVLGIEPSKRAAA